MFEIVHKEKTPDLAALWWRRQAGVVMAGNRIATVGTYLFESFSRPSPAPPCGQISRPFLLSAISQSPWGLSLSHKVGSPVVNDCGELWGGGGRGGRGRAAAHLPSSCQPGSTS